MNPLFLTLCLFGALGGSPARLQNSGDATAIALADISQPQLSEEDRTYQRYVWIPPWGDDNWLRAHAWAVNMAASHSANIVHPTVLPGSRVARWDLRLLAPDPQQLYNLVQTWEQMKFNEVYFHGPLKANGKVALPQHQDSGHMHALAYECQTGIPIVRADYLIYRMLSTIDDGLYYDFLQIERKPKYGTAQEAFLSSLGADEKKSRELVSQLRAVMLRSNVTAKPRRVDVFTGSVGLVMVTHDAADESRGDKKHPAQNLFAFTDAAREVIAERPNGLHAFALFGANGDLQDSAPDNIVCDHTIPSPNTRRLSGAIACIRCHGPQEGIQPCENDLQKILAAGYDVFEDESAAKNGLSKNEAVDFLSAAYTSQLDRALSRARDDYAAAVFRATAGLEVVKASSTLAEMFGSYVYDAITPEQACRELGYDAQEGEGVAILERLLPRPQSNLIVREHPFIIYLKSGVALNRKDWEAAYHEAATRAARSSLTWRLN